MRKTLQAALVATTLGITVGAAHAQSDYKPASRPAAHSSGTKHADHGSGMKDGLRTMIHSSAEAVQPVKVGERAPTVKGLRNARGEAVDLEAVSRGKTTLLVFYRGGWCPYCNAHLAELAKIQPELAANGVQIVAISPDSPETLAAYPDDKKQPYLLLSDSKHEAAKAFGVAFAVDAETQRSLKNHGFDLVEASGNPEVVLPVPSVFVIGPDGLVKFSHANPDYTKRLSGAEIMRALGIESKQGAGSKQMAPGSESKHMEQGSGASHMAPGSGAKETESGSASKRSHDGSGSK
ncbi:MAG: hypothetical protein Kow0059_20470 [Candidatus Sumerlaeia bacterium]